MNVYFHYTSHRLWINPKIHDKKPTQFIGIKLYNYMRNKIGSMRAKFVSSSDESLRGNLAHPNFATFSHSTQT